jgi:hypothetical protein
MLAAQASQPVPDFESALHMGGILKQSGKEVRRKFGGNATTTLITSGTQ